MDQLLATLSEEWAIRALIASCLVGVMCGIIGCFIVLRNMSMIGDALSHAILPGIFFAFLLLGEYNTIGFFVGSVIAGLIAAASITWIQHNVKTKNDAAIGIVFTVMFSIGVIGISSLNQEHGVHLDLRDFLFGQILGISNQDIILTGIFTIYSLVSIVVFYRHLFITTFQPTIAETMGISVKIVHYFLMLMLSFAVVAALRTVGVILVVAMLITPAATALLLTNRLHKAIIVSGIVGLFSAAIGLILAIVLNTPPGPTMCVVATFLYLIAVIASPEKGLLAKFIRNRRQRIKIIKEDILRQAIKYFPKGHVTVSMISERLGLPVETIKRYSTVLSRDGYLKLEDNEIILTLKGRKNADDLVRKHRLWESYQVSTMGLTEEQIHDEADRLEHVLSSEIIDEVDEHLGYPDTDPHGSPIPKRQVLSVNALVNLRPRSKAKISKKQISDKIESELWELGLLPGSIFNVLSIEKDVVRISHSSKTIDIPASLAGRINVDN